MKDHGLEGKETPKLNYDISSMAQKTPVMELLQIVKSDSADCNTTEKQKITRQKPFDFQTDKRIRLQFDDENGQQAPKEDKYEPLWQQLERNFQLRSEEKPKDSGRPRKLTRPISPNLQIVQRLKFRDGMALSDGDFA